jgi:hypothetical protein
VVGLGAGVGFNGFILAWWVSMLMFNEGFAMNREPVIGLLVFFAASAVSLFMWVRMRRRIRKMPVPSRWVLASSCIVLSIGSAVMFFGTVR